MEPGSAGRGVSSEPWTAHGAGEITARAGELEHRQAAEAVADRRDTAVDLRMPQELFQPCPGASREPARLRPQRADRRDDALAVPRDTVTIHVAGEDDVAERCHSAGAAPRVVVETGSAMDDQDARPPIAALPIGYEESSQVRVIVLIHDGLRLDSQHVLLARGRMGGAVRRHGVVLALQTDP